MENQGALIQASLMVNPAMPASLLFCGYSRLMQMGLESSARQSPLGVPNRKQMYTHWEYLQLQVTETQLSAAQ